MHRSHLAPVESVPRPAWTIVAGEGPVVAVALHAGHDVAEQTAPYLAVDENVRRRQEDPFSDRLVTTLDNHVLVHRSRFEVDLNRPRARAVYREPRDAWGLQVWHALPPAEVLERGLALYDRFYASIKVLLEGLAANHGQFVVLDLHTYNHRRAGPTAPPEPKHLSPDINLGTGRIDRRRWAPVIEAFVRSLRSAPVAGRHLDVRENIRHLGGYFPAWIEQTFPGVGCALAVEVKKFFMNEWTAKPDIPALLELRRAIATAAHAVDRIVRAS